MNENLIKHIENIDFMILKKKKIKKETSFFTHSPDNYRDVLMQVKRLFEFNKLCFYVLK